MKQVGMTIVAARWHRWRDPVSWMGKLGFLFAPVSLFASYERGYNSCQLFFILIWPWLAVWAVGALGLLILVPFRPERRWSRLGLAVGLGTWLTPLAIVILYDYLH